MYIGIIIVMLIIGAGCFFVGYISKDNTKESLITGFKFAIVIEIIFAIVFAFVYGEDKADERLWNNGYCPTCNEKWEFINKSSGGRMNVDCYCYICPNCKELIELRDYYK